jgi:hypothetical protein
VEKFARLDPASRVPGDIRKLEQHWNRTVRGAVYNPLQLFININPGLFDDEMQ